MMSSVPSSWILQLFLQLALLLSILTIISVALGEYMARVFEGKKNILSFFIGPIERGCYRLFGIDPSSEMDWKEYVINLLIFNAIGVVFLFLLQITQQWLPLNPQNLGAMRWDTALNSAISLITNTNWQSYDNETTTSYLTRLLGVNLQNFLSAASGIAVAIALIQGFRRKTSFLLGNFWVNLTRAILYVLLPLAVIMSLLLVSQGVVQNFSPTITAFTLQGEKQSISQGPAASNVAIKHLGSNGGGVFNANSAHPYENPTPLSDYVEILGLMIIAAAFPFAFGAMLNHRRQGAAIFTVMLLLYITVVGIAIWAELHGNPLLEKLGVHHGANMEGKEVRFGLLGSTVFAISSTTTSTGAVNAMLDSFMPLSSLILIFNMVIGEVIFGGVGTGFIVIIFYAILTMFLIGLMIGRSSELYGKKLEPYEMVMAIIGLIVPAMLQLVFGAITCLHYDVLHSSLANHNHGAHGLTEILYAFASTMGNNGSVLRGVGSNTLFYNLMTAVAMLLGRFLVLIPAMAIAGSLAQKKLIPVSSRFPTASPLFVLVLAGMIIVLGSLTFLPVFVLGPILEHLTIFS